jgi:hypothetical protein
MRNIFKIFDAKFFSPIISLSERNLVTPKFQLHQGFCFEGERGIEKGGWSGGRDRETYKKDRKTEMTIKILSKANWPNYFLIKYNLY